MRQYVESKKCQPAENEAEFYGFLGLENQVSLAQKETMVQSPGFNSQHYLKKRWGAPLRSSNPDFTGNESTCKEMA